jgi:hypothetical protein
MARSIIFAGSRAQRPGRGGQMWVFLQYLLGFRRLGWDVLYLDALEPARCVNEEGGRCALEDSWNVRYFRDVMKQFGLENHFALACDKGRRFIGLSRQQVLDRVKVSECLINVMGFLKDEEILHAARHKVFLDIDPGFGQMWRALGLSDVFAGHDAYCTVGMNVGRPECAVPTCGIRWITTPPPVVLDQWPHCNTQHAGRFTSVATWRGIYGPVEYQGQTYGLRVHEFRKFVDLPRRTRERFELALDIHPDETRDLAQLRENQWQLVDPAAVVRTPNDYRTYIEQSKAEFGVAKNMYVQTRSGWISDRTVCYLASGRPALVQDTGIRGHFPDEGLLTFSTVEEAAEGVERIGADYERQARAARRVAQEHFDSDKVLGRLLERLGVGSS